MRKSISEKKLNQSIGRRIRIHRLTLNLSQEEFSKRIGISRLRLVRIELGLLPIKPKEILKMAKIFEIPTSQLFYEAELDMEKIREEVESENMNDFNLEDQIKFTLELSIRNYFRSKGIKNPDELDHKVKKSLDTIVNN
jgi:transcriptional regulator with XRE-family HTH domain